MNYEHILVRYGEMALKGKNRGQFEKQLVDNIKRSLKDYPQVKVNKVYGRLYLELNGTPYEEAAKRLEKIFGIISFSPTKMVEQLELEKIQQAALEVMSDLSPAPATFKVVAKRPNKRFPYPSMELNNLIGGYVLHNSEGLKVDVHNPEVVLQVEIRLEGAFISCKTVKGMGGLPVGSGGKAMLMLSGGIDSPVAGWMMMKRGVRVEAVHFHSYPFTSERAKEKVADLARIISQYGGGEMKLHVVPFTEIQTQIRQKCPEHYTITIMRRFMMRITQQLAEKRRALAIATGENLGQVASQTMESMETINKVVNIPVIRPLVCFDKLEIIGVAHRIGTYETSILPYEDCCTIFVPKSPVTRPNPEAAEKFERELDVEVLVADAVARTEVEWVSAEKREEMLDLL